MEDWCQISPLVKYRKNQTFEFEKLFECFTDKTFKGQGNQW